MNILKEIVTRFALSEAWFLIVVTAKLTGFITWSWWWIFAPLWIPLLLVIIRLHLLVLLGENPVRAFKEAWESD